MDGEVQYERMLPRHIVAAREPARGLYPVEPTNGTGRTTRSARTRKVHALANRCAQAGGGLVFPPLSMAKPRRGPDEANGAERAPSPRMKQPPSTSHPATLRFRRTNRSRIRAPLLLTLYQVQSWASRWGVRSRALPVIDHAMRPAASSPGPLQQPPGADDRGAITDRTVLMTYPSPRSRGLLETSFKLALVPGLSALNECGRPAAAPRLGDNVPPVREASPSTRESRALNVETGHAARARPLTQTPQPITSRTAVLRRAQRRASASWRWRFRRAARLARFAARAARFQSGSLAPPSKRSNSAPDPRPKSGFWPRRGRSLAVPSPFEELGGKGRLPQQLQSPFRMPRLARSAIRGLVRARPSCRPGTGECPRVDVRRRSAPARPARSAGYQVITGGRTSSPWATAPSTAGCTARECRLPEAGL